jgi:hypothetical protein
MEMEDEEEVDIEELLAELMTERKKYGGNKGDVPAKKRGDKKDTAEEEGVEDYKKKAKKMEEQLKIGETYDFEVLLIEPKEHRMSLKLVN